MGRVLRGMPPQDLVEPLRGCHPPAGLGRHRDRPPARTRMTGSPAASCGAPPCRDPVPGSAWTVRRDKGGERVDRGEFTPREGRRQSTRSRSGVVSRRPEPTVGDAAADEGHGRPDGRPQQPLCVSRGSSRGEADRVSVASATRAARRQVSDRASVEAGEAASGEPRPTRRPRAMLSTVGRLDSAGPAPGAAGMVACRTPSPNRRLRSPVPSPCRGQTGGGTASGIAR